MEQFLIHKYANIITPVEKNLTILQDFIYSNGGGKEIFRVFGVLENVFSITLDKKKYHVCFSRKEKESLIDGICYVKSGVYNDYTDSYLFEKHHPIRMIPNIHNNNGADIIIPEDDIFSKICEKVDCHILKIRNVLDECIRGNLPHKYLYLCYKKAIELDCLTLFASKWNSFIGLGANVQDGYDLDIDNYIDLNGILLPSLQRSDIKLEYTKKCMNCGTYYQAKGQKAVFCSEACRSSYRRKMKKQEARPPTS